MLINILKNLFGPPMSCGRTNVEKTNKHAINIKQEIML